jgi:uncharacterized membrane protein
VPSSLTPRDGLSEIGRLGNDIAQFWTSRLTMMARCALLAGILLAAVAHPVAADFRLCNNTGSRVGVAVGYKDADGWTTEGWWNVAARTCETLLRGGLVARFYYIYAVDYDRGGEWSGRAYMCTRDKEFTIRGIEDCLARGYERAGFFEVDTGEQRSWTVQLTETGDQVPTRPLQQYTPLIPGPTGTRQAPPVPIQPGGQTR